MRVSSSTDSEVFKFRFEGANIGIRLGCLSWHEFPFESSIRGK